MVRGGGWLGVVGDVNLEYKVLLNGGCGFSQGYQSVCVNEGLKGCRSGVGSGWL